MQPRYRMTNHDLIERVRLHSGLDASHACVALEAVLASLRGQLGLPEAETLADALPDPLAEVLRRGRYSGSVSQDTVETQVAWRERVPVDSAREHVAAVCRALAESLPEPSLDCLRRAVPSVAPLLADEQPAASPAPRRTGQTTLAEGRPGSTHPVSESGAAERQSDSVAIENPHGDTKLSSASGLTQERERESMAEGRDGSSRPISAAGRRPGRPRPL